MKKLLIGVGVVVVLAGGFYVVTNYYGVDTPWTQKISQNTSSDVQPEPRIEPKTPSFHDGELYIDALAKKDPTLCAKITNEKLRERCQKEVKAS